jgi:hypothetical protein
MNYPLAVALAEVERLKSSVRRAVRSNYDRRKINVFRGLLKLAEEAVEAELRTHDSHP